MTRVQPGLLSNVLKPRSAISPAKPSPTGQVEGALDKVLDDTPTAPKELLDDAIDASISAGEWRRVEGLLRVTISEASCRHVYQARRGRVFIVGVGR